MPGTVGAFTIVSSESPKSRAFLSGLRRVRSRHDQVVETESLHHVHLDHVATLAYRVLSSGTDRPLSQQDPEALSMSTSTRRIHLALACFGLALVLGASGCNLYFGPDHSQDH